MVYLACAICVLGVWILRTLGTHLLPSDVAKDVFGSRKRLHAFLSSQQVTAARLHPKANPNSWLLTSYNQDAPVPVAPSQIQALKGLLAAQSSYPWGSVNACFPNYGVLLTFRTDQRPVQIAICFECSMIGVFDGENPDHINAQEAMNIRTQLLAVVKTIFPKDTEIQSLE
jgi:hypothetical protein